MSGFDVGLDFKDVVSGVMGFPVSLNNEWNYSLLD